MDPIKGFFQNIPSEIGIALVVIVSVSIFYIIFKYFLKKWFFRIRGLLRQIVIPFEKLHGPIRLLFPSICFMIIMPFLSLPENIRILANHILTIWLLAGIAWLIIRFLSIIKTMILNRYSLDVKDNLKARRISTQLNVIQRVFIVIIVVVTAAAILMTFDKVRQIGFSILASAGIAGIIIGFAAQRSLANLIAGIQIAITQPIRIDDVVIVENEWGVIEEITLTYVIIRIWDQRRLVVPITYFIERPFQNWTRKTAELLGTVYIYADYGIPVDEVRHELKKIVGASPLWDKRVAKIQVTNATEKTMEMRALISAENSSNAWQ